MNKKLGQLFAGIAIIAAGMGITLLSKERKEIEMVEEVEKIEEIEVDA